MDTEKCIYAYGKDTEANSQPCHAGGIIKEEEEVNYGEHSGKYSCIYLIG
jgi:hypothetical protein